MSVPPLKITNPQSQVAVLNRWADRVIEEVNNLKTTTVKKTANVTLQTNNVANQTQTQLNLKAGTGITLTTDPFGAVTISGQQGDTRFIHRPDFRREVLWEQIQPVGGTVGVGGIGVIGDKVPLNTTVANFTDTIVAPTAVDMPGWNFTSSAGQSAADYRIIWGMNIGHFSRDFTFITAVTITTGLGSGRYWYTVTDGNFLHVFNNTDAPAFNYIGFRYSPTSPNWIGSMGNGAATTDKDTGIAVALNTPYQLKIDYAASSSTATFTINGNIVGTLSGTPPTSTQPYGLTTGVHATNATPVGYSSYLVYCESAYPFSPSILS